MEISVLHYGERGKSTLDMTGWLDVCEVGSRVENAGRIAGSLRVAANRRINSMGSYRHCINSKSRRGLLNLLACIIVPLPLFAPTLAQTDQEPPLLVSISAADIPAQAASERALLEQVDSLIARTPVLDAIEEDLAAQEQTIAARLISLKASLAAASSREAISEIEQTWLEIGRRLEDWEKELRARSGTIEQQLAIVAAQTDVWGRTLQRARDDAAPDEIVALAQGTAEELANARAALEQMRDRSLALQGKVGRSRNSVQEALDRASAEETGLLKNLARRDRPPLWSEAIAQVPARELANRATREISEWWSEIWSLMRSEADRVAFQVLILLGLALVLRGARRAARTVANNDPSVAAGMSVFERPVSLAALIALLLTPWLYVSTPPAVDDAVGLLLVLPVLRLVLPLLDKPVRPALYMLAALYVIDGLRDLVEAAPLVARFMFLFELVAAIAVVIWLIRSQALHGGSTGESASPWRGRIRVGLDVALVLLVVAALAAVSGFVRLAVLIGYGVLNSAYLALLLAALIRAADAVIALVLHSRFVSGVRIIANRAAALRVRLRGLLTIAAIIAWLITTLDLFAVRDPLAALFGGMLFAELRAGAIALSVADVLAFVITIVGAFFLARLITLILDEDVYSRVELGRGVPFAISAVVKYGIVTLGFILAVSAMGMGMDKITILLGALGVGLGFGLQNVVNNFVSGLILIFERPIQIGDSVEVGSVKGSVKRMGIRSSTIRSFEGADITIPNGTLLSDALTNWTMSDRTRRIEVSVGVAYGSDPDKVIEILRKAMDGQEGLLEQPEPQVLFTGFGESSLDFVLRAWVADNDEFVKIRSRVALAVNRLLEAQGIEIPFPQRDLHLRSVAPDTLPRS